jgi:hypothetical protein
MTNASCPAALAPFAYQEWRERLASTMGSCYAHCKMRFLIRVRHAINPWTYLADALTRLPSHPVEQLADFLPDRWAGAQTAA